MNYGDKKAEIGKEVKQYTPPATLDTHPAQWGQVKFTPIAENEFGTHPAFTSQHELNAWLLGNSGGGTDPQPTTPTQFTATPLSTTEIDLTWQ